jgi:type IV pilus assembly protein PilW
MLINLLFKPALTGKNIARPSVNRQSGMSLVEVMVAMTIGLVILIALGYFFISSSQINRTTDDVSRMQESGRNALELIGRAVRQAGYRRDVSQIFGGVGTNPKPKPIDGTNGAGTAADSITVKYNAQQNGDVDCTGATVVPGTDTNPSMVTAAFAISGGALTCNGATVVVDNIENMQITYMIDPGSNNVKDGSPSGSTATPTETQFKQIAAVSVALTVRGPTNNVAVGGDGHLRQTYNATFAVRNQAW